MKDIFSDALVDSVTAGLMVVLDWVSALVISDGKTASTVRRVIINTIRDFIVSFWLRSY